MGPSSPQSTHLSEDKEDDHQIILEASKWPLALNAANVSRREKKINSTRGKKEKIRKVKHFINDDMLIFL